MPAPGPKSAPGKRAELPPVLREEFRHLPFAAHALQKLLDDYAFETVLDIGSGEGQHADLFVKAGKQVTALDYGRSVYFRKHLPHVNSIIADFNAYPFPRPFDCIWCSHVLEHQLNPHAFLRKIHGTLKEKGILAITVPPLKQEIVGGHVSLWNGGLLLYHLVLAGFDCKDASVLSYGYNISVIIRKRTISVLDRLEFDAGDIRKIKRYLPRQLGYRPNAIDDPFDGNITGLNWTKKPRPAVLSRLLGVLRKD